MQKKDGFDDDSDGDHQAKQKPELILAGHQRVIEGRSNEIAWKDVYWGPGKCRQKIHADESPGRHVQYAGTERHKGA